MKTIQPYIHYIEYLPHEIAFDQLNHLYTVLSPLYNACLICTRWSLYSCGP